MPQFLGDDYLLGSPSARSLHEQIRDLPIIDAHNHADVTEIADNQPYPDLWQVEAATDHYVWELLRKRGVAEHLITGNASNHDKWQAMAAVFPELAGNPTYEWIHLDLKRLLGIDALIGPDTADAIWERSQQALAGDAFRPQAVLRRMNVEVMCSTDDPVDSLEHHRRLADSPIAGVVRPTFRPDKAMNIFKPDWRDYIRRLETRVNTTFAHIADLVDALRTCHDYFAENGCLASDHGVEVPYAYLTPEADADAVFRKALDGKTLTRDEEIAYMSYVMHEVARLDSEKGWVFQLHIGAVRDVRDILARDLGPDTGGDISNHSIPIVEPLRDLLNRFDGKLKTILYCLDPTHQPSLVTLTRAFGATVNLGSAWWFNDTPVGMRTQLEYIGGVDLLSSHAGMVSDSRKLFSYGSRHEMFRRVLCDVIGTMVEQGRVPMPVAANLVKHLAYDRPKALFGF